MLKYTLLLEIDFVWFFIIYVKYWSSGCYVCMCVCVHLHIYTCQVYIYTHLPPCMYGIYMGYGKTRSMDFMCFEWTRTHTCSKVRTHRTRARRFPGGVMERSRFAVPRGRGVPRRSSPAGRTAHGHGGGLTRLASPGCLQDRCRAPRVPLAVCFSMSPLLSKPNSDVVHKFWMNLQNVNSKINEHGLTLSVGSLCLCA